MNDLPVGVLGFAAVLALGVIVIYLIVTAREQRRWGWARKEQRRQWHRERLLSSLEALDAGLTGLTTAALRGDEQLARERVPRLAQAVSAVNRSGDDELCQLMEGVVACCDALGAAGRDGEDFDQLVHQLVEAQRGVYRRMEVLLDQTGD